MLRALRNNNWNVQFITILQWKNVSLVWKSGMDWITKKQLRSDEYTDDRLHASSFRMFTQELDDDVQVNIAVRNIASMYQYNCRTGRWVSS